jgi:hypothetical protein
MNPILRHALIGAATGSITDALIGAGAGEGVFHVVDWNKIGKVFRKAAGFHGNINYIYDFIKESHKLTAIGRDHIKEKNFALEGRRYPIHDMSHARAALSMVSKHGSDFEKAQVRSAVANKYPSLNKTASSGTTAAISALGGIGIVGGSMAAKAKADMLIDPEFKALRGKKKDDYLTAQMTSGFLDGALKGGVAAPMLVDFILRKKVLS